MVRSTYPPRPPGPIMPPQLRPPVTGIRGPIIPPLVRPVASPSITPTDKSQTTVYVGKIASTIENDFIRSLLEVGLVPVCIPLLHLSFCPVALCLLYWIKNLDISWFLKLCGLVKNWKRAQDPTDGTPKGFGICEFDSAEGVLRALRLLCKLNVDGQELMVCFPFYNTLLLPCLFPWADATYAPLLYLILVFLLFLGSGLHIAWYEYTAKQWFDVSTFVLCMPCF